MKTSNVIFSIAIYALAILSLIAIVSIEAMALSIPLVIIMNILAYQMVLRKYKKNPNERVENNTNDMVMLYLCKTGGCFWIAFCFCYILMTSGAFQTSSGLRGGMFILFIILFNVTPSVKKGVRNIQERYIYSQTNSTKLS
jgi:hypothetical protein